VFVIRQLIFWKINRGQCKKPTKQWKVRVKAEMEGQILQRERHV